MNARSTAIAQQNSEMDASTARAVAARAAENAKPRTALQAMAIRLQIPEGRLVDTLRDTVFSACRTDSEFAALIVVANEYKLNPLLKEIYAFPAKGSGIVPMVSIDGWVKLMESHPQFDGIEFDYHNDENGQTEAIEAVIYRKDRTRPIKVMEYMVECKGETIPWKKLPRRMLRHRALIQCARIAFGFSGIVGEGDQDVIEGDFSSAGSTPALPRQTTAEALGDDIPAFDKVSDELPPRDARGMTIVDEGVNRALDSKDGTLSDDNPAATEGAADSQRAEAHTDDIPMWQVAANTALAHVASAGNLPTLDAAEKAWLNARDAVKEHDDELVRRVDKAMGDKRKSLRAAKGQG